MTQDESNPADPVRPEVDPGRDAKHSGRDETSSGRHARHSRGGSILRLLTAALAVLVLLGTGLEWQIKHRAEVGLVAAHVDALPPSTDATSAPPSTKSSAQGAGTATRATTPSTATPTPTRSSSTSATTAENILLLGSDTRAGTNAAIGTDTSTAGVANSDVVMVAHISADRQHVSVLSIPRDTMIPAPTTCHYWDATTGAVSDQVYQVSAGERFHFNSGYSVGGPQCTVTEVQNLTGLHISRYIGIDFSGFQAMVDALGGVDVAICAPVVDSVLGTVVARPGVQLINGAQALGLVRARHVVGDTASDLSRIRRQQVVLSAILRQVTQARTLLNPSKLDGFLQAFVKNTTTDNVTIDDLVSLAASLGNLSPGVVTFYTLPTNPSTITDGALEVAEPAAASLVAAIRSDRTSATTAPSTGATAPKTPTVVSSAASVVPTTAAPSGHTINSTDGATGTVQSVNAGTASCAGPGTE